MRFVRATTLVTALAIGLAAVFLSLVLLGTAAPAMAQVRAQPAAASLAPHLQPPPAELNFTVVFTDPAALEITDLSGNVVGRATHEGAVRCRGTNCNQKTEVQFAVPLTGPYRESAEYRFSTRQALDPGSETAVVAGSGVLNSRFLRERFLFTATFANNGDGTINVIYAASRPDASFRIPAAPGTFEVTAQR